MPRKFLLLLIPFAAAGFSCQGSPTQPAAPAGRSYGEPTLVVKLQDPDIKESSGIARSHGETETYYTHNDSGDSARFWRFDLSGKTSSPIQVTGAKAVDWEDMASARAGSKSMLFFADIGDNAERRDSVQIYVVSEPAEGAKETEQAQVYDLKYPDKAHNAEAFLVHPVTGEWTIVTKTSQGPAKIFSLGGLNKPGAFTLKERGSVELGAGIDAAKLVTAGDFSPDGKFVVLRTYLAAYEFDVPDNGEWWKSKPRPIKTAAEIQGEAIAYAQDGKRILTTSEFAPCPVSAIEIRP